MTLTNKVTVFKTKEQYNLHDEKDRKKFSSYVNQHLNKTLKLNPNKETFHEFVDSLELAVVAVQNNIRTSEDLNGLTTQLYQKLVNCYHCFNKAKLMDDAPRMIIKNTLIEAESYKLK